MILDLNDLMVATPLKTKDVPVPELKEGASIRLMELDYESNQELDRVNYLLTFDESGEKRDFAERTKSMVGQGSRMVARSIVNEEGKRLYSEALERQVASWPEAVTDRLYQVAKELSKLEVTEEQEEKDLEN
jgi:hypothetical protein